MTASASEPGYTPREFSPLSENRASRTSENGSPSPGNATQLDLLEAVLRQTALESVKENSLNEATLEAFARVAQQFRGHAFELRPVAVELVHAALQCQFNMLASPSRNWKAISAKIAETLFEDPVAHDRLEALWKQLSESA